MAQRELDGQMFAQIVSAGARYLSQTVKQVDALNVFPVPDGDTGTNMNLTLSTGVEEMNRQRVSQVGKVAEALSRGLLMGARGNSGVILSQLFRGFAKEIRDRETISPRDFAKALQQGVDTAYKAVIKPVEGTVLTVAREAAQHGMAVSQNVYDLTALMAEVLDAAEKSLKKTPELLPVLKEVGVVDAGGQGLVNIYKGFLAGLKGEEMPAEPDADISIEALAEIAHRQSAQSHLATEDIQYGFCTEFIIQLLPDKPETFTESAFRQSLSERGDSLLVVADEDLVKVHIHTEDPLETVAYGLKYGEIRTVKIENMREQHRAILATDDKRSVDEPSTVTPDKQDEQRYAVVAVAMGTGIADILRSMDVDVVIQGGQTMNPSTEDLVKALQQVQATHYFILPNNSNVIMAAEQAAQVMDHPVTVLPSKTIPQGISAMLAFDPDSEPEENRKAMTEMLAQVHTGQVTFAVRDSTVGALDIKEGDYLGLADGEITVSRETVQETAQDLLTHMITEEAEVVTVFSGEDVKQAESEALVAFLSNRFPNVEIELHKGGQPLYYYLFAIE